MYCKDGMQLGNSHLQYHYPVKLFGRDFLSLPVMSSYYMSSWYICEMLHPHAIPIGSMYGMFTYIIP